MAFGIKILGDASGVKKAFKSARDDAKQFARETDSVTAGLGRARIAGVRLRAGASFGPIAAGLVVASQASRELSNSLRVSGEEAATTGGKLRNAGADILSGNIVGAIKALDATKMASSWEEAKQALDGYTRGTGEAAFGITRAIDKIELLVGYDRKLARLNTSFEELWAAAHPPTTLDFAAVMNPLLAGGNAAFGITPLDRLAGTKNDPAAGLSQQLKTAIAAAKASPGTGRRRCSAETWSSGSEEATGAERTHRR